MSFDRYSSTRSQRKFNRNNSHCISTNDSTNGSNYRNSQRQQRPNNYSKNRLPNDTNSHSARPRNVRRKPKYRKVATVSPQSKLFGDVLCCNDYLQTICKFLCIKDILLIISHLSKYHYIHFVNNVANSQIIEICFENQFPNLFKHCNIKYNRISNNNSNNNNNNNNINNDFIDNSISTQLRDSRLFTDWLFVESKFDFEHSNATWRDNFSFVLDAFFAMEMSALTKYWITKIFSNDNDKKNGVTVIILNEWPNTHLTFSYCMCITDALHQNPGLLIKLLKLVFKWESDNQFKDFVDWLISSININSQLYNNRFILTQSQLSQITKLKIDTTYDNYDIRNLSKYINAKPNGRNNSTGIDSNEIKRFDRIGHILRCLAENEQCMVDTINRDANIDCVSIFSNLINDLLSLDYVREGSSNTNQISINQNYKELKRVMMSKEDQNIDDSLYHFTMMLKQCIFNFNQFLIKSLKIDGHYQDYLEQMNQIYTHSVPYKSEKDRDRFELVFFCIDFS